MALNYNLVGVLHTNAEKFNQIERYHNLAAAAGKELTKTSFNSILNYGINKLKKQEEEFYKLIFPNDNITEYSVFIKKIQDLIDPNDAKAFERFSMYNLSENSLYSEMTGRMAEGLKSEETKTDLRKRVNLSQAIKEKNNKKNKEGKKVRVAIKLEGIQGHMGTTGKEVDIGKNFKDILKNSQDDIFPLIVKNTFDILSKEYKSLSKEEKEKYRKPSYIWVQENLARQLKDEIYSQLPNNGTAEEVFDWGFSQDKEQKIIRQNKNMSFTLVDNILNTNVTDNFREAFRITKKQYGEDFKEADISTDSNLKGFLGEFSGAMLFNYLRIKDLSEENAAQIVGQKKLSKWSEQLRSDIRLEGFGIQAKNWQESTFNTWNIDIKLHPLQILSRIGSTLSGEQDAELETYFANLAFNRTFAEFHNSNPDMLLRLLLRRIIYTGNFFGNPGTTENDIISEDIDFLDTSPIWLIGGKILVPGSVILKCLQNTITDFKKLIDSKENSEKTNAENLISFGDKGSFSLKFSLPAKGDEELMGNGFWKKDETGNWVFQKKGQEAYANKLSTNRVSTHLKINIGQILKETLNKISKSGDFSYSLF